MTQLFGNMEIYPWFIVLNSSFHFLFYPLIRISLKVKVKIINSIRKRTKQKQQQQKKQHNNEQHMNQDKLVLVVHRAIIDFVHYIHQFIGNLSFYFKTNCNFSLFFLSLLIK